jgi:hypothetical protein
MNFGVFADLDKAEIRRQKIGVAEIPEIRLFAIGMLQRSLYLMVYKN